MRITLTEATGRIQQLVGLKQDGKWGAETASKVLQALKAKQQGFFDTAQLNRIEKIVKDIKKMATDQETFDKAMVDFIMDLTTQIGLINKTVQAILDKPPTTTVADLTKELETLREAQSTVDGIVGQLPTSPTQPPPQARRK